MGEGLVWYFTFGVGHVHPETGEPLDLCYVRITGDWGHAREQMFAMFGPKWAHQYRTPKEAGVDRYQLRELPSDKWPQPRPLPPKRRVMDDSIERLVRVIRASLDAFDEEHAIAPDRHPDDCKCSSCEFVRANRAIVEMFDGQKRKD